MRRLAALIALVLLSGVACATPRVSAPAPRLSPEALAAWIAQADRLASRGCYLCLKEAAAAYASILAETDDPAAIRRALENNLMIALREAELRLPDSGALEEAERLQARLPSSYTTYFSAIDALSQAGPAGAPSSRERRLERQKIAVELEKEWPASAMKAYFYLSMAVSAGMIDEMKAQLDAIVDSYPDDLSLKYRRQAFLPTFSEQASRTLIGMETGFAEVHFLLGQRAVLDAQLADAHRELSAARRLLPDSTAISLVLANVTLSYARYDEALALFERVLASGYDDGAGVGRAKALSYLKRYDEAIVALDELLIRSAQSNPGEKYYWRAWNRLQLGQSHAAHDDAMTALNVIRNNDVYRLAGMTSFNLQHLVEARRYFEEALDINRADCDSERYLGQIDAFERRWASAFRRFSQAVVCYDAAIVRMREELAGHERDISGLSNGLISGLRTQIKKTETLRTSASSNAVVTSRNAESEK